jgi:hypothetical protein
MHALGFTPAVQMSVRAKIDVPSLRVTMEPSCALDHFYFAL